MNISEYRREYQAYKSALELETFKYFTGSEPQARFESILEQYGHLWTLDSITALQNFSVPPHLEAEGAGLRMLVGAAQIAFAQQQTSDITEELRRCESAARIEWRGESIGARDVPHKIAAESDAARRRDLEARLRDSVGSCNDLRAARFDALQDAARTLNFDNYLALSESVAAATDYKKMAASAEMFLERTSNVYRSSLANWAAQAGITIDVTDKLTYGDMLRLKRMSYFDILFPENELRTTYDLAMRNLGVRTTTGEQKNIQIVDNADLAKSFAVNPPEDVRLTIPSQAQGGALEYYRAFFYEAGRAQAYGWASRGLAARQPEFIYPPDEATNNAYGVLFGQFFLDPRWLGEHRRLREESAAKVARACALLELYNIRRACAKLRFAVELHKPGEERPEQLANSYQTMLSEACGFDHHAAMYLIEVDDLFAAANYLRAWMFAAGLGEYLRTKHGSRWWHTRAAGDALIDIWNTASRYSVEELAQLTGASTFDFDQLADVFVLSLSKGV